MSTLCQQVRFFLMQHNGLNMMRAALCSISFYVSRIFKFTKSFSMKMKLRHELYFLLGLVVPLPI
jgi:hypothetical protein